MKIRDTKLPGLLVIEPQIFEDERGFFYELFNAQKFNSVTPNINFVQDNISKSPKGTLRGLHFQKIPKAQGKLVFCISGEVFDVAVDIRRGSPTFGQWEGVLLSGENHFQVWVPPGFAHGFLVLSDSAIFAYKCSELYSPENEGIILWNDPEIGIQWPAQPDESLIAPKDKGARRLSEADFNFKWV